MSIFALCKEVHEQFCSKHQLSSHTRGHLGHRTLFSYTALAIIIIAMILS